MGIITRYIIAVTFLAGVAYGMECYKRNSNQIDKILNHCPGLFDPSSKSYCCLNLNGDDYCCDAEEFALKTGLGIIVPAIIGVVIIISLVVCCISCLCCTCCPWYRRRHRGTVYGNLQAPSGIHVIQPSPGNNAAYVTHNIQSQPPVYVTTTQAIPPQYPPPPVYAQEAYTKQAPYNPGYVQQQ